MTDWDNIFAKKESSSSSVDNPSSTISTPDATSPQVAVEPKPEVVQQPQELEQKPKNPLRQNLEQRRKSVRFLTRVEKSTQSTATRETVKHFFVIHFQAT